MEQTRHSALTHHRHRAPSPIAPSVPLAMLGLWIGALGATEARSQELVSRSSIARVTVQGQQASVQSDRRKSDWLWHVQVEQVGGYPGIAITKKHGRWRLREGDRVVAKVANRGAQPAKIVLVVGNRNSDGRSGCSASSAVIGAGEAGTVSLELGTWHGRPATAFDPRQVTGIRILVERPEAPLSFDVGAIEIVQVDRRRFDELAGSPVFRRLQRPFGRGINLGNALDAPREGAWGFRLEAWHFEAIAKAGFDFVRIPIRWSAHTKTSPPYTIDPRFAERVDWAIEQATKHGLAALINVHHFDEIMERPQQERARFLAIWKQLAERYRHAPDSVSFELLNEPHGKMSAEFWNGLLSETITRIRRSHPGRTIVVGPVRYNNIQALESLRVPRDPHIVVTVHYYNPFRFTHQGASWVGGDARSWLGTRWTGTDEEREAVRRALDAALRWAVQHDFPLLLGEFGAIAKADLPSRAAWTRCVAEESWKRKMGYAYWAFDAGFDAYDRQSGKWHGPIVDALVPGGRRR